jgi:WXG100 family type VII secretion target
MSAPIVQARYEDLEQIAARFAAAAEQQQALQERVNRQVEVLRAGSWQGKGVAAFLREMDGEVGPAGKRLIVALHSSAKTTNELSICIHQAEMAAAAFFRSTNDLDSEPYHILAAMQIGDAKDGSGEFLPVRDPNTYFSDQYLQNLISESITGADNPKLNKYMEDLLKDRDKLSDQEREQLLNKIADIRGRSRTEFREEYYRFLEWKRSARHPEKIESLLPYLHANHLGSTNSLRFGKVVGDTLLLDPVFGAMLNPTGGMPGSGQLAIPVDERMLDAQGKINLFASFLGPNPVLPAIALMDRMFIAVGQHSAAHDGYGFMYYQYGIGRGYDYLRQEPWSDPENAFLTGHLTGIPYWLKTDAIVSIKQFGGTL